MRTRVALGAAALATILGVLAYAQETQKVPGFGTGIIKVEGTVDVGNMPLVLAHQSGEWKVTIANAPDVRVVSTPDVSVAAPAFLKKDSRYEITWSTGDREPLRVVQIAPGGWVRVDSGKRERWVNLASARSVEEVAQ